MIQLWYWENVECSRYSLGTTYHVVVHILQYWQYQLLIFYRTIWHLSCHFQNKPTKIEISQWRWYINESCTKVMNPCTCIENVGHARCSTTHIHKARQLKYQIANYDEQNLCTSYCMLIKLCFDCLK